MGREAPSGTFWSGPLLWGHPRLAEGWWLGSMVFTEQLKEKGSRKEGETERGGAEREDTHGVGKESQVLIEMALDFSVPEN